MTPHRVDRGLRVRPSPAAPKRAVFKAGSPQLDGNGRQTTTEPDALVIRGLITGAWLCAACLAERTGLSRVEAYETLNGIAGVSPDFRTDVRRCDHCLSEQVVHRIG